MALLGRTFWRESLAVAAVGVIVEGYIAFNWETRPRSLMAGNVIGFGLVEQKGYGQVGSVVRAQVDVPGRYPISIALPNSSRCRVGSHIEIEEIHTLVGSRFLPGIHECSAAP